MALKGLNKRTLSRTFFSSCLIGLPASFVAISYFLRENFGISHTKLHRIGLREVNSGMSCQRDTLTPSFLVK